MPARDIEYIELYTSNQRPALDYFVSSLAFTQVAESAGSAGRSVLLRHGTVQLILTEGPATRDFLDAHGDGVADIAFTCDDVAGTCDRVVAAGGSVTRSGPGNPVASGFGDTRHTLIGPAAESRLPGDGAWIDAPRAGAGPAERIRLLDHVAVCVAGGTLEGCADFYTDGFGLARYSSEYTEVGDQAMNSIVVRSPSGGITFTILEPDLARKPGQLDAFLSRNEGPGVQHLAFGVDDIVPSVLEFRRLGVEFLHTPGAYYDMLAERLPGIGMEIADLRAADVLADRDEWGYLLQLFTRSPYERSTLFYELVQRRGARGFGSANIKALYEAVERDGQTVT
jgi:4-hydroxymandelate synthase